MSLEGADTVEDRIGICDWGCGREGLLTEICLDGRVYEVCPSCLEELRERFGEEEEYETL